MPAAATIGYLLDPTGPFPEAETKDAETAARALGVQLAFLNASTPSQIETAFTTVVERRIGALTIGAGAVFATQYEQIIRLAARYAIPVIWDSRTFPASGGLMNCGPTLAEPYRVAGTYAGRILSGEKPGDLPVQQPTKVELVINMKTAGPLGLNVPQSILLRADEVIE